MATLTKSDQAEIREIFFRQGEGKDHFKGANPSLSGEKLLAALQAIEDKWNAGKSALKADMDAAAGVTLTIDQAEVLGASWMAWKANKLREGF